MSTCAVLMVKDEADIIEITLRHLCAHVDEAIVLDNASADGTREKLQELCEALPLVVYDDPDPAYYQSEKTTTLAAEALDRGHAWVIPCDADEIWHTPDGRCLKDWLDGVAPDVQIVEAALFNHIPTSRDRSSYDPRDKMLKIGWRQREHQRLPKVACRTRPDLVIHQGNHFAMTSGTGRRDSGLFIRHFPWRTSQQYLRKIRNGEKAYSATQLPPEVGIHWRMFESQSDEVVIEHFNRWFYSQDPDNDQSLIYDPAPIWQ